jgi:hypothetical protein
MTPRLKSAITASATALDIRAVFIAFAPSKLWGDLTFRGMREGESLATIHNTSGALKSFLELENSNLLPRLHAWRSFLLMLYVIDRR